MRCVDGFVLAVPKKKMRCREKPPRNHLDLGRYPGRIAYESYPTSQANWHLIRNQIIHS